MSTIKELQPEALSKKRNPDDFKFETTAELDGLYLTFCLTKELQARSNTTSSS